MTLASAAAPAPTVDDVRAVTGDVWEACLASHGDPLDWGTGEPVGGPVARALVHIAGEWSGAITLEMSVATAEVAARVLLDVDDVEAWEVADAVGELVNIVGGNLKSLLPTPSKLSLPRVSQSADSDDLEGDLPDSAVELCRVDLSWGPRPVLVRVWS